MKFPNEANPRENIPCREPGEHFAVRGPRRSRLLAYSLGRRCSSSGDSKSKCDGCLEGFFHDLAIIDSFRFRQVFVGNEAGMFFALVIADWPEGPAFAHAFARPDFMGVFGKNLHQWAELTQVYVRGVDGMRLIRRVGHAMSPFPRILAK